MDVQNPPDYFAATSYYFSEVLTVRCLSEQEQVEIVCTYDGVDAPVTYYSSGDRTRYCTFHRFLFAGVRRVAREGTLYRDGFLGFERNSLDITRACELNIRVDDISARRYQSDWLLRHQRLWQFLMTCGSLGTYNIVFASMTLNKIVCYHRHDSARVVFVDVATGNVVDSDFPFQGMETDNAVHREPHDVKPAD